MGEAKCDVIIGEISTTFGLKGEVKVRPLTNYLEQFEALTEVCAAHGETDRRMLEIEAIRQNNGTVIIKFVGIDSIDDAEALRGAELRIPESELIELPDGEYYIDDIVGLEMVTTDGRILGRITDVLQAAGNDVYVTDQVMIPAVKEFIADIDLDRGKVIVRPIEGLVQE
jgi:16S rRNA processing protein RimM